MILIIDSFDSFTYIIYQYFSNYYPCVKVCQNDTIPNLDNNKYKALVIGPGPGQPHRNLLKVVKQKNGQLPILGICLGHQAIALACGAKIVRANNIMHGKQSYIEHSSTGLFTNLTNPLKIGRYHSWVVGYEKLPATLKIAAISNCDRQIMAIEHENKITWGVQFHPESILTKDGKTIVTNFLSLI